MLFYEAKIKYKSCDEMPFNDKKPLAPEHDADNKIKSFNNMLCEINTDDEFKWGPDEAVSFYLCGGKEECLNVIFAHKLEKISYQDCILHIVKYLEDNFCVRDVTVVDIKELSAKQFNQTGSHADSNGIIRNWRCDRSIIGSDYFSNNQFKVKETVIDDGAISLDEVKEQALGMMADDTFLQELDRIYSPDNTKEFLGNPVHYKISASNGDAAMDMVKLLVQALYANKRIPSKRISRIWDIDEGCFEEEDLDNLFENAQGSTIAIELSGDLSDHGNYASSYQRVIDDFTRLIRKYHMNALCILIENTEHPGFANSMTNSLSEEIDIIAIKEGYGDRGKAKTYFRNLVKNRGYDIEDKEMDDLLKGKKSYRVGEIYNICQKWFRHCLRDNFYKAYKTCDTVRVPQHKYSSEPYRELQEMVGLHEIKQIVDEIIDTTKVQMIRSKMGLDQFKSSKHMIFTGNPGSAKTTVARLLSEILQKEGVLENGNFVEVGRADLVGKYVGWTAPTVQKKFRIAKGGILFIDEAYSLVSDDGYGDEAISTIVQEMENNRDSVMVIFAGYPDKMKKFLDKNEGLRSRIAFHLDFPDYNPDEMTDILKLMISRKGYIADEAVYEKCRKIFVTACRQEEFGNGRFARNLLEQAEMLQSKRIMTESKGKKITKKAIQTLKPEDFDVNVANIGKEARRSIGFVA